MNTKKRAIAFVIILFLFVATGIVYIFSELYTESDIDEAKVNEDAIKFKEEYEKLNDVSAGEDKKYRTVNIAEDNPFIYRSEEDIIKAMDEKESFIVYFGFSDCPWCRSILNPLIDALKDNNIDKIYYVDIKNIRDTYVLDEEHNPVRSIEGTQGYYDLLTRLDSVLDDYGELTYTVTKKKKTTTKSVKVEEKRIFAPNIVVVRDGIPIAKESGITSSLTDPYMEISKELYQEIKDQLSSCISKLNESLVCEDKGC